MNPEYPLIFDIAKSSFVDGPGIRTVVFFKGCPLKCLWCQNPESQSPEPEIFFSPEECISCGNCSEGKKCYTGARQTVGRIYTPDELMGIILQDRTYYEVSGGGVTFSGGEPFFYYKYLKEVLAALKREKINTVVQTCGFFNQEVFDSGIFEYIDTVYYDFKIFDPVKHREYTGVSNELIIDNFLKLIRLGIDLLPGIPLVPGYTATEKNIAHISEFLRKNNILECRVLPYNTAGLDKWKKLGKNPPPGIPCIPMTSGEEKHWHRIIKQG